MEGIMDWGLVSTILASFGGGAAVVAGIVRFFGKFWLDQAAAKTNAKYEKELEGIKQESERALDEFKAKSKYELKKREEFSLISQEVYQKFFEKRVSTYTSLLKILDKHSIAMDESFVTDECEAWGDVSFATYEAIRSVVTENQLYISNALDITFSSWRIEAAEYIKKAEMDESFNISQGMHPAEASESTSLIYLEFAKKTSSKMGEVFKQITEDVKKLRSRIEMDNI